MIFSIVQLSNLGIYSTIPPKFASDFKRYNLIYGWNGSGKSTLSRFFGFVGGREIPKEFDTVEKGYKIYRNKKEEATNLSEGEKTAIAFIYFITKLKENGKKIEDSILIIDDPISSLSFKFPKQRADLAALLLAALPKKEDDIIRERIYKFVNIYSHEKKIDVFEEQDTDILDTNNHTVINDILDLIKGLDENHYTAMVEKVQNEIFVTEEKR